MSRAEQTRRRGDGGVYLRGRIWWVFYSVNGEKVYESSGSDKESEARRLLKKRMGEIVTGNFIGPDAERVTIAELADDVLTDYRVNEQASIKKAERSANRVKAFFGKAKAHSVKGDAVKKFIDHRQQEEASNGTINRELAFLKRCFNLGIEAEKISRKPYIPMLEESNVRQGFFERGEFLTFRAALEDYLKPVATFAYYTGWRRQEIFGLTWAQVDLAGQTVRLNAGTTKNKAGRVIFLDGELLETIEAQWQKRKVVTIPGHSPTLLCPYVFHRNGKRISDPRKAWRKACEATGLGNKLLHDFRRTAVRDMVRAGVPENVAMQISGHKTRSVFDRYDIVDENDLRQAAQRHGQHVREQEEKNKKVVAIRGA